MLNVSTPGRPSRSVPAMVAGLALRARAHRWITSWLAVTRLRPGRSGRSSIEVTCWDDRTERDEDRPVRTGVAAAAIPAPREGAALAPAPAGAFAARARDGCAFLVGAAFLPAGAFF